MHLLSALSAVHAASMCVSVCNCDLLKVVSFHCNLSHTHMTVSVYSCDQSVCVRVYSCDLLKVVSSRLGKKARS